ncbi:alpha/beta hydrolase [Candidatus Woesearchaeota archaeon]|nr:alpha/beta hydrolase [Candidatus Woesearchaeota archaeon]
MLTESHVLINGKRAYYLTGGKGETLLFLHGWLLPSAAAYRKGLELLSGHFRVYAPSMVSEHAASIHDYEEYISGFASELKLKNIVVVGHSFGAAVAAELAAENQGVVRKLVLVDALGIPVNKTLAWWLVTIGRKLSSFRAGRIRAFFAGLLFLTLFAAHMWKKRVFSISMEMANADYSGVFRKVSCRTLVVWADRDEMFPVSHAGRIASMIKGARVRVVKGTHDWPIFDPEGFYRAVIGFLRD